MLAREGSPNSRINAVRRFVGAAPQGAAALRLYVQDSTPLNLGQWQPAANEERREAVADEIEALMLEHANENRRYKQQYLLVWVNGEGAQITVKPLSVYSHQLRAEEGAPEDIVRELDGSNTSQVAQSQRHLEAMTRIYLQGHQQIVSTLAQCVDRLAERNANIEVALGTRHTELLDAKETILGLLNDKASEELTPAQVKAFEILDKFGPALMAYLQSRPRQAPPPKPNGTSNGRVAA